MKHSWILDAFLLLAWTPTLAAATDDFGYQSVQTGEDGASPYFFQDISTTGVALEITQGDSDDGGAVLTLGAPFSCYGQSFSQLLVSTNGYLSTDLTESGSDSSNDTSLPTTPSSGGGLRIYPLHDDLEIPFGSAIYSQYFPNGISNSPLLPNEAVQVIQWNNVSFYGLPDKFTFQALLFDKGTIQFVYPPGNPDRGTNSTTGLQNEDSSIGLLVAQNTAESIPDSSTITIYPPQENSSPPEILDLALSQDSLGLSQVTVTFSILPETNYALYSGDSPDNLAIDLGFTEVLPQPDANTQVWQRFFDSSDPAPDRLFLQVRESAVTP